MPFTTTVRADSARPPHSATASHGRHEGYTALGAAHVPHVAPAYPGAQVQTQAEASALAATATACALQCISLVHRWHAGHTTYPAAHTSHVSHCPVVGDTVRQVVPTAHVHMHTNASGSVAIDTARPAHPQSTHDGYPTRSAAHWSHPTPAYCGGHVVHSAPCHCPMHVHRHPAPDGSGATADARVGPPQSASVHARHDGHPVYPTRHVSHRRPAYPGGQRHVHCSCALVPNPRYGPRHWRT